MNVPKIRVINDWYENEDYLHTDFMLDVDYHNEDFGEEHARWLDIPMDEIIDYIESNDYLVTFEDRWDYSSETTYQEYSYIDINDWLDNRMDDVFVREYLERHISKHGLPDITILV